MIKYSSLNMHRTKTYVTESLQVQRKPDCHQNVTSQASLGCFSQSQPNSESSVIIIQCL